MACSQQFVDSSSVMVEAREKENNPTEYERLQQGIALVTTDEGFSLPVPLAARAHQCATKLLKWMLQLENKPKAITFAITLVKLFKECCSSESNNKSIQFRREKMWEKYYQLRSSDNFCTMWSNFIKESINEEACPIFYQFVTDAMFEKIVIHHFPVKHPVNKEIASYFSYEELNALRYTAGYIIKAVLQKIEKSKSDVDFKEEIILCLTDLKENEESEESHRHQSSDWVNCIDRGGLQHVSDITFSFFAAMELEFRRHIDVSDDSAIKSKAIDGILENNDVQVYWESLSREWEEGVASSLLKLIVEHWITVRGYSQASAFLEHYKQSIKVGVQKSKGLRKKLF